MKRYGHLFEHVCSFEALTRSAHQAARGKKTKPRVALFLQNLENEVIEIEAELLEKTYQPRPYRTFKIHDPKERMICAADFRDRVVHHAVCSVLEPIFERAFISDTYACRKHRGTLRAIKRAQAFCRRYCYFLKLDVHKFFDSVDHEVLKYQLRRKVKDLDLLRLLDVFIDHPVPWTEAGKGIPIGNLTSQHFANFYLSGLDHYIKEYLRIEGYLRYMDDLVLFADEKETLWDAAAGIEGYLEKKLRLKTRSGDVILAPVTQGLPFLGFQIFPGVIRISRKGWRRFRRKMITRNGQYFRGDIDHKDWHRSVASLIGNMQQADTRNLRAPFISTNELLSINSNTANSGAWG
ncbi:MAG: group II intron reverse transcriptase domain-containing protein [Deltaproteobacteria bacterium]|nr:group II intron reverse transcriptase domain-containing protein [Deltaproteobacteria bacterium]